MPGGYDGDIKLSVELDPKDVVNSAKKMESSISRIFKASAGKNLDASTKSILSTLDKLNTKSRAVRAEMEKLSNTKSMSSEYRKITELQNQQIRKYQDLSAKMQRFQELGGNTNSRAFKSMQLSAEDAKTSIQDLKTELRDMRENGTAYIRGEDTQRYKDLAIQLGELENQTTIAETRLNSLDRTAQKPNVTLQRLASTAKKVGGAFKRVGSAIAGMTSKLITSRFNKLKDQLKGVGKQAEKTSMKFTRLLKYMIGLGTFRAIAGKLRQAIQQGIEALSNASPAFKSTVNAFKTSLNQLKGSFTSAFAPIATVVLPLLTSLINKVAAAIDVVARFIATLTGQHTYMKAVANDLSAVGGAAGGAAAQAKELKRQLAGFDDVEILSSDKDSGGGGGGGGGGSSDAGYSLVETAIGDFDFGEFFQPFVEAWQLKGQAVMDAWKGAIESVWQTVISIKDTFMEVWTNGTGTTFLANILSLVEDIGGWIKSFSDAFREAWKEGGKGEALLQSFFDKWNAILEVIDVISDTLQTVWDNGFGKQVLSDIFTIITNINNIVGNLAQSFKNAWSETDRGKKLLETISSIITTITGGISDMTGSIADWASKLNFGPAIEAFDNFLKKAQPVIEDIKDALQWVLDNVILPAATWAIESGLPAFLEALGSAMETLHAAIEAAKPFLKWLWDNFLKPLAEWTGSLVVDMLNDLKETLDAISKLLQGDFSVGTYHGPTEISDSGEVIINVKATGEQDQSYIDLRNDLDTLPTTRETELNITGKNGEPLSKLSATITDIYDKIIAINNVPKEGDLNPHLPGNDTVLNPHLPDYVINVDAQKTDAYKEIIDNDYKKLSTSEAVAMAKAKADKEDSYTKNIDNDYKKLGNKTVTAGASAKRNISYNNAYYNKTGWYNTKSANKTVTATAGAKSTDTYNKTYQQYTYDLRDKTATVTVTSRGAVQLSWRYNNNGTVSGGSIYGSATGGVFTPGRGWSSIPQYARGTLNAGTVFAAGEAGPEVVGHIGGRTEVLNRSQLASTMYSSIIAAMRPLTTALENLLRYFSTQLGNVVADIHNTLSSPIPVILDTSVIDLITTKLDIPAIVTGRIIPYETRLAAVEDRMTGIDTNRISTEELRSMLGEVITAIDKIQFYIGDEQIARHASSGTSSLNRRFGNGVSLGV